MASANKTPILSLNSWLGTDGPKRTDFNEDNAKLDAACGALAARAEATEGRLAAHTGNGALHVTAEEKEQWNGAGGGSGGGGSEPVFGSYVGNGAASRSVSLGFRPRFGYFFAKDKPITSMNANFEPLAYAGFFSEAGSSYYVTVTDTGFDVKHHTSQPTSGSAAKYNENGYTFIYLAWR